MLWMYVFSVLFAAVLVAIRQAMVSHKAANNGGCDAPWEGVDVSDVPRDETAEKR